MCVCVCVEGRGGGGGRVRGEGRDERRGGGGAGSRVVRGEQEGVGGEEEYRAALVMICRNPKSRRSSSISQSLETSVYSSELLRL